MMTTQNEYLISYVCDKDFLKFIFIYALTKDFVINIQI